MPDKAVKISESTEDKLVALKHELENEGVPYFKRTRNYLIGVAVGNLELAVEAAEIIRRLVADKCKDCSYCDSESATPCEFSIADARAFQDKMKALK
jgi:hypothetical protein